MAKSYMVSSDDFHRIFGNGLKIIKFQQLRDYSDIRQLLPKQRDFCILFYQDDKQGDTNIGHWCSIYRDGDEYQFYDPYGLSQTKELGYIEKDKRILYGEGFDYLTKLLDTTNHTYNPYDFQSWDSGTNTCGRWSILKAYAFLNGIITPKEFYKLISKKKKDGKFKTFDDVAVYYTS